MQGGARAAFATLSWGPARVSKKNFFLCNEITQFFQATDALDSVRGVPCGLRHKCSAKSS